MITVASLDCESLTAYTSSDYMIINQSLRGQGNFVSEEQRYIDSKVSGLDKSFKNAPTVPENLVVYREMGSGIIDDLKPGDMFQDKGFVSTTIKSTLNWGGGTKLEVRVPKGTKGIYVAPISEFKSEKELLLNRGTKFRIVEKTPDVTIVEVVP